uniref:Uncharacterized protein n=1 Tax=Arundo donax TaxID=35708 RepID=A0A0A9AHC5_ARUDO
MLSYTHRVLVGSAPSESHSEFSMDTLNTCLPNWCSCALPRNILLDQPHQCFRVNLCFPANVCSSVQNSLACMKIGQ